MEQPVNQQPPVETKKKFTMFGFTSCTITGIIMIVVGFFLILIGIFMLAYIFMMKGNNTQQPPPKKVKKQKPKQKEEPVVQPPQQIITQVEIDKKEDQIKQNAKVMLEEDYMGEKISHTIIEQSDTEDEREVKDDSLLD